MERNARTLLKPIWNAGTCASRGHCTLEQKQQARQTAISVDAECRGLFWRCSPCVENVQRQKRKRGTKKSEREQDGKGTSCGKFWIIWL
ncbi:MAG: hypothetical protein ACLRIL_07960 [Fusicatenibacter saccharivorans]